MKKQLFLPYFIACLLSVLFFVCFSGFRTVQSKTYKIPALPQNFINLLSRSDLEYIPQDSLEEIPLIKNRQMNYEYGLKWPGHHFEVRYAIRPLDSLIINYTQTEKTKKAGDYNLNPNNMYPASLHAILFNITGGNVGGVRVFPKDAVKKEFNADWGATSVVPLNKEFGQDYKNCMIVAIHKENLGDAYIFYLFDDRNDINIIPKIFHSLKFK